jgi:hypothetical protein
MLQQEFGRVDRTHSAEPGEHYYRILLNVNTWLSLWTRNQREKNPAVRRRHDDNLFDVTELLLLPHECYHVALERAFENPNTFDENRLGECGNQCSFCTNEYRQIAGAVSRRRLVAALKTQIFDRGAVKAYEFVSFINDNKNMGQLKKQIWGETANVSPGNVHGLVLMLLAAGIIEPVLASDELTGSDKIKGKDVLIRLAKYKVVRGSQPYEDFVINNSNSWKGFHLLND